MIERLEKKFINDNIINFKGKDEYNNKELIYPEALAKFLIGAKYRNLVIDYEKEINKLLKLKNNKYEEFTWGLPFIFKEKKESFLVTNSICLEALIELKKSNLIKIEECEIIKSNFQWLFKNCYESGNNYFFYSPHIKENIYNAYSKILWILYEYEKLLTDEEIIIRNRILESLLEKQDLNGAWDYSDNRGHIDFLHSCYILEGLLKIYKYLPEEKIKLSIERGLKFLEKKFINSELIPEYYLTTLLDLKIYPLKRIIIDMMRKIKHGKIIDSRIWSYAAGIRVYILAAQLLNLKYEISLEKLIEKVEKKYWNKDKEYYNYRYKDTSNYIRHQSHIYEALAKYDNYRKLKVKNEK